MRSQIFFAFSSSQFIRKELYHMFGKESLEIVKVLKQSLETGVGMIMEEISSFQAVCFHYSSQLSNLTMGLNSYNIVRHNTHIEHKSSSFDNNVSIL